LNRFLLWTSVAIGGLMAAALLIMAWNGMPAGMLKAPAPVGSTLAITLVSGQVFFGTLEGREPDGIALNDVFDLQVKIDPQTNVRSTQLFQRSASNSHGPTEMFIPADKILFLENVKNDTAIAKAIAKMRDGGNSAGIVPSGGASNTPSQGK
jgi:hypothetical protein